MANLDDLGFSSPTDKTLDENIETLRQIRQNRATPVKQPKQQKSTNTTKTKKKDIPLTPEQAARLLQLLSGESK